jgi:hypothetical protein
MYLLLLIVLFLTTHRQRTRDFNPSTAHLRAPRRRSIPRAILVAVYYILLIANILMQTLEIVRLELISFGIGLLPFSYVALLLALLLHVTDGLRGRIYTNYWIAANTGVLTGLMAVSVVKTVSLVLMEGNGISRAGSKYPMTDQVIDVAVMAGVFLVLAVLEVILGAWKGTKSGRDDKGGIADNTAWGK